MGRRLVFLAAALSGSVWLSGCGAPVLTPAGPVADSERQILFDAMAIMLTIVGPTILAIAAFAWWFRSSNPRAKRRPDWAYSGRIELVVWAVPLLTIMFLGGLIWTSSHQLDPFRPLNSKQKPLEVQVVSMDWKWLFIYPEQGVASVNTLAAPAGRPIHFTLTSSSVMDSFFVPNLGSQIYTMNGMTTQLSLQADKPGVYQGLSTHFSGDGFPGMHFDLHADTPAEFDAWVAHARAGGPVLDRPGYAQLAKQSSDVRPYTYRAIDPALFQDVVSLAVAPSPGPVMDRPSQQVSPKSPEHG